MTASRKAVLFAAAALFLTWALGNFGRLTGDDEGFIRFVLGSLFAVLILLRWKPHDVQSRIPGWLAPTVGGIGAAMALVGIVFGVNQFEWFGLILVLYGCLRWALPDRFGSDIVLCLLLLYWVHPLPGQVFGTFQLGMQILSIQLSEWLLQVFNARVWADGFILFTSGGTFGVPESCSGMRTAVTVLLCTLGAGILLRLRWYEVLAFTGLGLVQVLLLNAIRISSMVYWAPRMPPEWAQTFLHDTLGIFLLLAIMLVQVEMSLWRYGSGKRRRIRQGVRRGELEPKDRGSVLPGFWRYLAQWGGVIVAVVLVGLLTAAAVIKSRADHRIEMVRGVIPGLLARESGRALAAVTEVLTHAPDDRDMWSLKARIHLELKQFEESLDVLGRMPGELGLVESIWKSWALMSLDRMDEAKAVVDGLPEDARRLPGVAIIRAEYAAREDDPGATSQNLVLAARWTALAPRVRALFPYLASREQWDTIAKCNSDAPFDEVAHALLAVRANLRQQDVLGAEAMLRLALAQWPDDRRFLKDITWVALKRPGEGWEEQMAASFDACAQALTPDQLAEYLGSCFQLRRPDMAWQAYHCLAALDPADPALALAVSQFGHEWFQMPRKAAGVPLEDGETRLDLRPLVRLTGSWVFLRDLWQQIPLGPSLLADDISALRSDYLDRCHDELGRRQDAGDLSYRMKIMRPFVMALREEYAEAQTLLDDLLLEYPEREREIRLRQATLFTQQQRWQDVYECLRVFTDAREVPSLNGALHQIHAMMSLNFGVSAMQLLRDVRDVYPGAPELVVAEAAIWESFGFKEQALFELGRAEMLYDSPYTPQLMYETGRFEEARRLSRALGIPLVERGIDRRTPLAYAPAELTVSRPWPAALTRTQLVSHAKAETLVASNAQSPFVRDLANLGAAWYGSVERDRAPSLSEWEAAGRDPHEKGLALHRLAVLAARQGYTNVAQQAVARALDHLPRSAILHRMQINLGPDKTNAIEVASSACPDDPDIWLASLLLQLSRSNTVAMATNMVVDATHDGRFSVETVIRAGDLMFRAGLTDTARVAARHGVRHGRGALPSYVLALRCALRMRDWPEAMKMALTATKLAHDPTPFYQTIVQIKAGQRVRDGELIKALEFLTTTEDDDPRWAENLGAVYFLNRDTKRALSILRPVIASGIERVRSSSLVLAAEASRQQDEPMQALKLMESARSLHPDSLPILNNLIYYLAADPRTASRARALVDTLLEEGRESFAVLDTVAMVYLNTGDLDKAREYMDKALALLPEDHPARLETRLNSAELLYASGALDEARKVATEVRTDPGRDPVVDRRSQRLLAEMEMRPERSPRR